MNRDRFGISFALASCAAILCWNAIGGTDNNLARAKPPGIESETVPPIQLLIGDADLVDGKLVVTWARVLRNSIVKEVGVTIPVALFDEQPTETGNGPAGAIASLVFPEIVRDTTYFNHFQLHTSHHGHETPPGSVNPIRNSVPHFDFHYYAIAEEEVWLIPASVLPPPLLPMVPANRLPKGYTQPGPSVPEMGRHASPVSALLDPEFLSTVMIAGFLPDASLMHFIEPMISREFLLQRRDFELVLPVPQEFGQLMLFPTKFTGEYDADIDAYHFIFSEFVLVE